MTIYGARGTETLLPEQRPRRRRKMRGRTQLYRGINRPPGPTLDAILKGAPAYVLNPADFKRARERELKRIYGRGIPGR